MTESEAKVAKTKAETTAIYHNIALKWYAAIVATALGGTPLIEYLRHLF